MTCLVMGERSEVARLHPSIKGVKGAQTSGASLISFNAPSLCSYDREQGLNAPTSEYIAFAYGTALNYLIKQWRYTQYIGDTLVVCWAGGEGEEAYQSVFGSMLYGNEQSYDERTLQKMVDSLVQGEVVEFDETRLDPEKPFYVLGLSPNAARLSVRFFLKNTFQKVLQNIQEHQERLKITGLKTKLSIWQIMNETVRDKADIPSVWSGEMLRAVLENRRYPATIMNGIYLRIRAERNVTSRKAAIIKAYYLKNTHQDVPKEVLQVALNEESRNPGYILGRLFSILEDLQEKANGRSNIRDRFFSAASATPQQTFTMLLKLAQSHMKKLNVGSRIFYDKQVAELLGYMEELPVRMNMAQQSAFQLGYYHQTQKRYEPKKDKNQEEVDNE